jgi:glycosyltransferase involved in cell wall biosynthesis
MSATGERSALLLSTHPPGGHSGPGMRGLITLEALRACCDRVDALAAAPPGEEDLAADGVEVFAQPGAPSAWRFLVAAIHGGSSFVPERGDALRGPLRERVRTGALKPSYDVVWAHFPLMAGPGDCVGARARVLDVDTAWGAARRRAAAQPGGTPVQRAYRRLDAAAVAREERRRCNRQDHVVVASEAERERLESVRPPVTAIPNCVADPGAIGRPAREREGLLFVGNLAFDANVDAVRWLIGAVLPVLRAQAGDARLTVAGRSPASEVRRLCAGAGVELVADAPSLEPLYARARAVVAPLRMGGGTHVKLIEAMAYGHAVVATPVATEGLELRDGEDVLMAGDAESFARACARLLAGPEEAARLGARARRVWHDHHRPEVARDLVVELVERLL